ncbi:MAG: hypothetical protein ABFD89_24940 [Bryobacteraceae bacterium]
MKNDDRDELDELIDSALARYSSAEPLDGLEDRVLRRVQGAQRARHSPWRYRLAYAIPVFAVVLIAGVALWMGWDEQPRARDVARNVAVPAPSGAAQGPRASPTLPVREARPRHATTKPRRTVPAKSLPKEECFPSPAPLTAEERALVAWVSRAPTEAAQAFGDMQKRSIEPIKIEPIQMPPLQMNGGQ